jgi:hypothetical protein
MFPELTIERVFRRELDSLPLPAEGLWVPNRRTGPSAIVAVSVVGAALVLIIAAAGLIREASGAATQPRGVASAPPSLPARATCAPPAFGANGRCVTFLPNSVRNPTQGYNLTIPGDWREVVMPAGTEPVVPDGPPTARPSLTAPFLIDRHVFTARPAQEWVTLTTVNMAPAWDLDVQVWDRQGRTALEWSRTFGPCDFDIPNYGPAGCDQSTETIRGLTVVVTTVRSISGWQTTSYYLERGDQMLILRYGTDPNIAPPAGVTNTTLEGIVHSIGLV